MKVSVEISLYPLFDQYEEVIIQFIKRIKSNERLQIKVNGLSTQIFGSIDDVMPTLTAEIKTIYEKHQAVLIIKMANGTHKEDQIPKFLRE